MSPAVEIHQIGSDQGLLQAPAAMPYVQLAPGECADLIVDFAEQQGGVACGKRLKQSG